EKPLALDIVREYLTPLLSHRIDTLVLGCTHYPLLKGLLGNVAGPSVKLIDSAEETARVVGQKLKEYDLEAPPHSVNGHRQFYVSDAPEKFEKTGRRFLGQPIPDVKLLDIGTWV